MISTTTMQSAPAAAPGKPRPAATRFAYSSAAYVAGCVFFILAGAALVFSSGLFAGWGLLALCGTLTAARWSLNVTKKQMYVVSPCIRDAVKVEPLRVFQLFPAPANPPPHTHTTLHTHSHHSQPVPLPLPPPLRPSASSPPRLATPLAAPWSPIPPAWLIPIAASPRATMENDDDDDDISVSASSLLGLEPLDLNANAPHMTTASADTKTAASSDDAAAKDHPTALKDFLEAEAVGGKNNDDDKGDSDKDSADDDGDTDDGTGGVDCMANAANEAVPSDPSSSSNAANPAIAARPAAVAARPLTALERMVRANEASVLSKMTALKHQNTSSNSNNSNNGNNSNSSPQFSSHTSSPLPSTTTNNNNNTATVHHQQSPAPRGPFRGVVISTKPGFGFLRQHHPPGMQVSVIVLTMTIIVLTMTVIGVTMTGMQVSVYMIFIQCNL